MHHAIEPVTETQDERLRLYEQAKAQFKRDHPEASSDEYEAFCVVLAEEMGI